MPLTQKNPVLGQARRLGGFGGFGRTAHTQAKVRGAGPGRGGCRPLPLSPEEKLSSADTAYVVAYRLAWPYCRS